jgi:hypothetical protein
MGPVFAELANVETAMGQLSLRRRREPSRQVDVFEVEVLERVFDGVRAEVVEFPNSLTGGTSSNAVYLAVGRRPAG